MSDCRLVAAVLTGQFNFENRNNCKKLGFPALRMIFLHKLLIRPSPRCVYALCVLAS